MSQNLENIFGQESDVVAAAAAKVFNRIDQLDANSKEAALEVLDGISEGSTAMFAGWMDNMSERAFPIETLREEFDNIAEIFARDRDVTGDENPNKQEHLKRLTTQSAFGIKTTAARLGLIDEEFLDKVVSLKDFE